MKLSEVQVEEYLLEKKVAEEMRRFLMTRVLPVAAAVGAALAYLGWDYQAVIKEARNQANEDMRKITELRSQTDSELQKNRDSIEKLRSSVRQEIEQSREAGNQLRYLVQEQTANVARATGAQSDLLARTYSHLGGADSELAAMTRRTSALSEVVANAVHQSAKLERDVKQATENLRAIIAAHVIDTVVLRSDGTKSVRLPLPSGGFATLYVSVGNIKPVTALHYQVDSGLKREVFLDSDQKAEYKSIEIGDVEGGYEIQPDIVFYARGGAVHDFVMLRIRRAPHSLVPTPDLVQNSHAYDAVAGSTWLPPPARHDIRSLPELRPLH